MADKNTSNLGSRNLPSAWEHVANKLLDGGIPQVIAGPAGAAISRLIAGAADIPAAWFERRAQKIRDDTIARTAVIKDLAAATGKAVSANPGIVDRSIDRWLGTEFRKQENREAVAAKAIVYLQEDPPPTNSTSGPSDDFMNIFERFAENASSENLRDMFARVLTGEIRKPGSFSLRTLHFVSIMDQQVAEAVRRVQPWVNTSNFVINLGLVTEDERLLSISLCEDVGLVRSRMLSENFRLDEHGRIALFYAKKGIIIHGTPGSKVSIPSVPLTPVGIEVMSLLVPPEDDFEVLRDAAKQAKFLRGVTKVEIADLRPDRPDKMVILNSVEV